MFNQPDLSFIDLLEEDKAESELQRLRTKYPAITGLSQYWLCRMRLASKYDDPQRVVCLIEQAYVFEAKVNIR